MQDKSGGESLHGKEGIFQKVKGILGHDGSMDARQNSLDPSSST